MLQQLKQLIKTYEYTKKTNRMKKIYILKKDKINRTNKKCRMNLKREEIAKNGCL